MIKVTITSQWAENEMGRYPAVNTSHPGFMSSGGNYGDPIKYPGLVVCKGECDQSTLDAMEADPAINVISSDEVINETI